MGLLGDDDTRDAPPRCGAALTHDSLAVHGVESAGRLVGEQQSALADDRTRDRDALAFAARQLVRVAVGPLGDVELFRLEAIVRWLDAADVRLKQLPSPTPTEVVDLPLEPIRRMEVLP